MHAASVAIKEVDIEILDFNEEPMVRLVSALEGTAYSWCLS